MADSYVGADRELEIQTLNVAEGNDSDDDESSDEEDESQEENGAAGVDEDTEMADA